MNSSIKVKHLIIFALVIGLGYIGFANKDEVQRFIKSQLRSEAEQTVDNALTYLKDQNGQFEGFDPDYTSKLLSRYSFYKIERWELEGRKESDEKYLVAVRGTAINGFGAELKREPVFLVQRNEGKWKITDSYGVFVISGFDESDNLKTDLEKDRILNDVKEKCKIEKWSFKESYSNSIKGTGTIYNGGEIPVEFVKIEITYSNRNGQTVNTDDFYAVSAKLYPGQRRTFDWYTSNCYDCNRASIRLVFDKN